MFHFIHHLAISRRPVITDDGKLHPDIVKVVQDIESKGEDPVEAFRNCRRFLDGQIEYMKNNPSMFEKWQFQTKDPYKPETLGALKYMRDGLSKIIMQLAWKEWC